MRVLFVCKGNASRSQMAEAYFQHFSEEHEAGSAGVSPAGSVSEDAERMLEMEGVSTQGQHPKELTEEMVREADRIVAMCNRTECPVYLLKSGKAEFWDVPDPKGKSEGFERRVKDQIKGKVLDLLRELGEDPEKV